MSTKIKLLNFYQILARRRNNFRNESGCNKKALKRVTPSCIGNTLSLNHSNTETIIYRKKNGASVQSSMMACFTKLQETELMSIISAAL
jgi:hypothetical protein